MKCPQLSKPEATAARNQNSIGDRTEKQILWEKPGSVGGPFLLWPVDPAVQFQLLQSQIVRAQLVPVVFSRWLSRSAVFNSSPRAPPLCTFCMFLSSLQTFVLFDRKCPAKWTSQDIPPSFQFEASVYVPFKGH